MGTPALKSVDTNILLRFLLKDDPVQTPIAIKVLAGGVFVPLTVLLETGWVLGKWLGFDRKLLCDALTEMVARPEIHVADAVAVGDALALFAQRGDFADAIHLVGARGTEAFVTFDKGVRSSESIGVPVELAA
jgi:predicted nucleic-acid-binding protein